MKYRPFTTEQLCLVRHGLPHGYLNTIARKTGYSPTYISRVMVGKFYNSQIIDEVMKMYSKCNAKTELLMKEIERLNNNG
jgi:hypothetical protein